VTYGNSKLTEILKKSLSGNARSFLVATIDRLNPKETKATLEFASRASKVKTRAEINRLIDSDIVNLLRAEIRESDAEKNALKQLLEKTYAENDELKEQLEKYMDFSREENKAGTGSDDAQPQTNEVGFEKADNQVFLGLIFIEARCGSAI
jgi:hypothetical protein